MSSLEKLEKQLNEWFNIKAPWKLPHDARKAIAEAAWIIALVVGIVQLWGVWALWHVGHYITGLVTYQAYPYINSPGGSLQIHLGFFYWVSFLVTGIAAIMLLAAAPKLKKMEKAGWNLLYYAALLNALYAVLRLFAGVDGLFGDFLGAAIGAVVGAYFLFQIRDSFTRGEHLAHEKVAAGHEAHDGHSSHRAHKDEDKEA